MKKQFKFLVTMFVVIVMLAVTGCTPNKTNPLGGTSTTINVIEVQTNPNEPGIPSDGLTELTPQQIAKKVMPSIVYLVNMQNGKSIGAGSGIIMNDGYILTNAHVVESADYIDVMFSDESFATAVIHGIDSLSDLAVIRINTPNYDTSLLKPATFRTYNVDDPKSKIPEIGDSVAVIGNPGGLSFAFSATYGHISAMGREIPTKEGYSITCIQTDAAINPGNSGGALVDCYGNVIGINSSKIAATEFEGLGFAIDMNAAIKIIPKLLSDGKITGRPTLGITYNFGRFTDKNNVSHTGIQITAMKKNISNQIKVGDIITKFNDTYLTSENTYSILLKSFKPNDVVTLEIYRYKQTSSFFNTGYFEKLSSDVSVTLYDYAENN